MRPLGPQQSCYAYFYRPPTSCFPPALQPAPTVSPRPPLSVIFCSFYFPFTKRFLSSTIGLHSRLSSSSSCPFLFFFHLTFLPPPTSISSNGGLRMGVGPLGPLSRCKKSIHHRVSSFFFFFSLSSSRRTQRAHLQLVAEVFLPAVKTAAAPRASAHIVGVSGGGCRWDVSLPSRAPPTLEICGVGLGEPNKTTQSLLLTTLT